MSATIIGILPSSGRVSWLGLRFGVRGGGVNNIWGVRGT